MQEFSPLNTLEDKTGQEINKEKNVLGDKKENEIDDCIKIVEVECEDEL